MKIEVKNSKIKELPFKANVIHTTKSFNMEINDSIKSYQIDDDAFFVYFTDGSYIVISYDSNGNLELVTLGDNNLGILKLNMVSDEILNLLSHINRGMPGLYIYNRFEHIKSIVDNILGRYNHLDSFYDIIFYDINRELRNIFKEPKLKSLKPTAEDLEEYSIQMKFYETFKSFETKLLSDKLYWFIYETLSAKYIDSINKEREMIKNYIEDRGFDKCISKTRIYDTYNDFRFEDAKYHIDEIYCKYEDIENFLEVNHNDGN